MMGKPQNFNPLWNKFQTYQQEHLTNFGTPSNPVVQPPIMASGAVVDSVGVVSNPSGSVVSSPLSASFSTYGSGSSLGQSGGSFVGVKATFLRKLLNVYKVGSPVLGADGVLYMNYESDGTGKKLISWPTLAWKGTILLLAIYGIYKFGKKKRWF